LCEYKHKTPPADAIAVRARKPPPPQAIEPSKATRAHTRQATTPRAAPRVKTPPARPGSPVGSGRRRGGRG
jgi:hypothetical protein